jgi:hypothetical protein
MPNVSITVIPIDVAETGNSEWLSVILIYSFLFYYKAKAFLVKKRLDEHEFLLVVILQKNRVS